MQKKDLVTGKELIENTAAKSAKSRIRPKKFCHTFNTHSGIFFCNTEGYHKSGKSQGEKKSFWKVVEKKKKV